MVHEEILFKISPTRSDACIEKRTQRIMSYVAVRVRDFSQNQVHDVRMVLQQVAGLVAVLVLTQPTMYYLASCDALSWHWMRELLYGRLHLAQKSHHFLVAQTPGGRGLGRR